MRAEVRNLSKCYGRVRALDGVSLDIPAGRRMALVGPNGSGKSTFIRALAGLISFDGEVLLDGQRLGAAPLETARRLAYVPQVAPQLAVGVGELVSAISGLRGIEPAAVEDVARELELDVAAVRRRAFRDLSGGMKQKLLVSLALATPASFLILDEPTASLDPRGRERFFELYERVGAGRTLVLASHRLEELSRLVDHVALLREGRIAYEGSRDAFLAARAETVVELRAPATRAVELGRLGFARGLDGWWSRRLARVAAPTLVADAARVLGAELHDVTVRNLETIESAPEPDAAKAAPVPEAAKAALVSDAAKAAQGACHG